MSRSAGAPPGFSGPSTGGGLSSGVRITVVIVGLLVVAAGFLVLTVVYWRQTRPTATEGVPVDVA